LRCVPGTWPLARVRRVQVKAPQQLPIYGWLARAVEVFFGFFWRIGESELL